jgi:hypothetical protein
MTFAFFIGCIVGLYMFFRPFMLIQGIVTNIDGTNITFMYSHQGEVYTSIIETDSQYEVGQKVNLYLNLNNLHHIRESNPKQTGLLVLGISCLTLSAVWLAYYWLRYY